MILGVLHGYFSLHLSMIVSTSQFRHPLSYLEMQDASAIAIEDRAAVLGLGRHVGHDTGKLLLRDDEEGGRGMCTGRDKACRRSGVQG